MKNKIIIFLIFIFISLAFVGFASSAETTVCCQKTVNNLYCQNVPADECSAGSQQTPAACSQTSFCKPGVCYDNSQGTCMQNTPQIVCNNMNGSWSEKSPEACNLGCCILGDQAAFVPLTRCKKLSSFLGLETNYNKQITNEVSCILSVSGQEKGACIFESEFERACKISTRAECGKGNSAGGEFYARKLCTAPELNTKCGRTKETMCLPGKDEVYFKDTCGNPANIYDSSKVEDPGYWTDMRTKEQSCNPNSDNGNSKSCGNCNYLLGSFCRDTKTAGASVNYGGYVCDNLNCEKTQNGNSYKHGESWCVYNDAGTKNEGNTAVGARFYKHICINGEEIVEQCADFKQAECIEDKITAGGVTFSQAACRVNRWQDCLTQTAKDDCENSDKRDCFWKDKITIGNLTAGACLPKVTPGLKFWEGEETKNICAQASATCVVTYEKGLFGGSKCVSNCECLEDSWAKQRNDVCMAIGDCGAKINWVGDKGYKTGYNVTIK